MDTSAPALRMPTILDVDVADDTLRVTLSDGRTLAVPSAWYPRLAHATASERANWTIIDGGSGIHWPQLDEDISLSGLLAGTPSQESQQSLRCWLAKRTDPPSGTRASGVRGVDRRAVLGSE